MNARCEIDEYIATEKKKKKKKKWRVKKSVESTVRRPTTNECDLRAKSISRWMRYMQHVWTIGSKNMHICLRNTLRAPKSNAAIFFIGFCFFFFRRFYFSACFFFHSLSVYSIQLYTVHVLSIHSVSAYCYMLNIFTMLQKMAQNASAKTVFYK